MKVKNPVPAIPFAVFVSEGERIAEERGQPHKDNPMRAFHNKELKYLFVGFDAEIDNNL